MAFVNAALQRLRTGGYTYTLEPGVAGAHSADEFWFDTKMGFCEHIASAFAILMRNLDVPARIVTGYQGGEINGVDGYWTVRQADAHAWTEVWIEDRGWVRIDPTGAVMPSRIGEYRRLQTPRSAFGTAFDTVISPTIYMQMRAVWEAVNNGWNQWVLNYTQERQFNLLRSLGMEAPSWQDLARLLGAIAGLAALIGIAWSLWERSHQDPWQRMMSQARQQLKKVGMELPEHLPPRGIAARIRAHWDDTSQTQPIIDWLLRVERARYAPRPDAALADLQRDLRRMPWPSAPPTSSGAAPQPL
ncbi:transglutaminase-like domain-containing protein [Diaphorobacter aerolatus]|uniref:transglutaminase-like domain-containing protein n=1 Tax=Diaphorobacter aerolatus TaxID=1288495 RepID=UPI00384F8ADD